MSYYQYTANYTEPYLCECPRCGNRFWSYEIHACVPEFWNSTAYAYCVEPGSNY